MPPAFIIRKWLAFAIKTYIGAGTVVGVHKTAVNVILECLYGDKNNSTAIKHTAVGLQLRLHGGGYRCIPPVEPRATYTYEL